MNAKQLRTAMQEEMESGKRFAEVHNADKAEAYAEGIRRGWVSAVSFLRLHGVDVSMVEDL